PGRTAPPQLRSRKLSTNFPPHGIDADAIAAAQQADRSAEGRFGRDVSHDESMTAAGKSAIGNQRYLVAEARSGERARRTEHLPHPGPAAGAFAADHHHTPRPHCPAEDRGSGSLLTLKDACTALESLAFLSGDLRYRALWSEVAVQDDEMTVLL